MVKNNDLYVCNYCDAQSVKWSGRCNECGKWGTMQLKTLSSSKGKNKSVGELADLINLSEIKKITR
jgi:DNA repair protein RadA/Sms